MIENFEHNFPQGMRTLAKNLLDDKGGMEKH